MTPEAEPLPPSAVPCCSLLGEDVGGYWQHFSVLGLKLGYSAPMFILKLSGGAFV